ncbi:glycosyltransferase [Humibacter sp. BT305]|nr:glycosyltransferase [Humibacter sp. BT305]
MMATDSQWRGNFKQLAGRILFRIARRAYYDWAFVPGDRQVRFARRLGFRADEIQRGSVPAHTDVFDRGVRLVRDRAFLYVGRYVPEKGLDVLFAAYALYRERSDDPWELHLSGTGPEVLPRVPGIVDLGYLRPEEVAEAMCSASCFVLASRFEPWGVVLHEAATAGMPLIASEECGAASAFIVNGVNGAVVPTGDAKALAQAMLEISARSSEQLNQMSLISRALSLQSSPNIWVDAVERVANHATIAIN